MKKYTISGLMGGPATAATAVTIALSALGGCSTSDDAAAATSDATTGGDTAGGGPNFNYVPLNDNACKPGPTEEEQLRIAKKLGDLGFNYTTAAAKGLALCDSCTDNPFAALLKSVSGPVSVGTTPITGSFHDHVNKALGYPYRELLVSWREDADRDFDIVLSQGINEAGDGGNDYLVAPESLADGCTDYDVTMFAGVTREPNPEGGELATATSDSGSDRPFGFIVPAEFPATEGLTDQEIGRAIEAAQGLPLKVEEPAVTMTVDENGNGKGTLTGYIQLGQLVVLGNAGVDLAAFASADHPNHVKAVFSFTLERATVRSAIDLDLLQVTDATAPAGKPGAYASTFSPIEDGTSALGTPIADPGGECSDCTKPDTGLSETICAGAAAVAAKVPGVLVEGDTGTFTLTVPTDSASWTPAVGAAVPVAGAIVSGASADAGSATITYSRPWRAGAGYRPRPKCVDILAGTVDASTVDNATAGWVEVSWRPEGPIGAGCARTVLVCQTWPESVCGANSVVNADGACACQPGFTLAFDECVDPVVAGCAADAILSKDETGAVSCACPDGKVGDGKTCVADPCAAGCPADTICVIYEDRTSGCEPGNGALPSTATATPSVMSSTYTSITDAKADDAEAYALDEIQLTSPEPTAKPASKPGAWSPISRPPHAVVTTMTIEGKGAPIVLKEDQSNPNVLGSKGYVAPIVLTKVRGYKVWQAQYLTAENFNAIKARFAAKTLGRFVSFTVSSFNYNSLEGEWYRAFGQSRFTAHIERIYLAPLPVKGPGGVNLYRLGLVLTPYGVGPTLNLRSSAAKRLHGIQVERAVSATPGGNGISKHHRSYFRRR